VGDTLANVSGGNQKGNLYAGELSFGATLDLQKLIGLQGGSLHITFDERSGNNASTFAGTNFGLAGNHGPNNVIRLANFYYEQALFHDRVDITFGRTNPTADFATSAISCQFLSNILCAQPGIWYFGLNDNQAYPQSTWGGRVNFQLTPEVYLRVGGFEDDPTQVEGQGFTWRWDTGVGAFIPYELGYQTTFSGSRYPAKYDIGGYYDTGTFSYPGTPLLSQRGRTAYYAQGQQVVWRPDPATQQSLTVFGGALVQSKGFAPYWGEYYLGVFDQAPFASRPADTVGLVGAYLPLNKATGTPFSKEWIFEVNYGFTVFPGVTLKPAVQYVVHPDQIGFVPQKKVNNAVVVGVQFSVNFGAAAGFPQFIPY
jgi:porin